MACPRSSLILFTFWALLVTLFMAGPAFGVSSSEYNEERAEASLIKAVAAVEDVRVIRKERRGSLPEQWFIFYLDNRPAGYLHITADLDPDAPGTIRFQHEFLVGEQDGDRQLYVITTRAQDDERFIPEKLAIAKMDISPEGSKSAPVLEVGFRVSEKGEAAEGILSRGSQKGIVVAIPHWTTTDFLLFEWVGRQPFGSPVVRLNVIETLELHLKKGVDLVYRGRDSEKGNLHRFELQGPVEGAYWLNDQHELIEVRWDTDKLFKRSSEAEARTVLQ